MKYVYDDGGRAAAGFRGSAGDCVTRAIAIAASIPYREVYDALNLAAKNEKHRRGKIGYMAATGRGSSARNGVFKVTYRPYLEAIGWRFTPTMSIGSGCRVHLVAEELPAGRLIVSVSRHYTAVIDGVIHDTDDPNDRPATIYPPNTLENIPAGATRLENGNGWIYRPGPRCVYGYWRKVAP